VVAPQESWEGQAQRPISLDPNVRARRLAARWLVPVDGVPIERGAILVGSDGRIQAVGPDSAVPRPDDIPAVDLENAVILPGLINTHTHLELTGFEGRVAASEFATWIRQLRALKTTRTPAEFLEAARRGLRDCFAAGITTVADTGDSGAVLQALAEADASGIAYQEVFGPHPDQASESLAGLQARVRDLSRLAGGRARIGVSPHAPYTVSGPLFSAVARWAQSERLPLAVHIAESPAETQFLRAGSGPFADAWLARGIPLPSSVSRSPIEWLAEHGVLSEQSLCIHAVQVGSGDIRRMAESGVAVAHCPLSNRAHSHGSAPLVAMLDAGIRVGLGTDSVVSVGRLDLMAEARAAWSLTSMEAGDMIELCTLAGARALGIDSETGSLQQGKWADFTAIRLLQPEASPEEQVLASSPRDVILTYLGGREVHRSL
jgi:cytosine/adenosine deaminase-related metal-dependent hydrolase